MVQSLPSKSTALRQLLSHETVVIPTGLPPRKALQQRRRLFAQLTQTLAPLGYKIIERENVWSLDEATTLMDSKNLALQVALAQTLVEMCNDKNVLISDVIQELKTLLENTKTYIHAADDERHRAAVLTVKNYLEPLFKTTLGAINTSDNPYFDIVDDKLVTFDPNIVPIIANWLDGIKTSQASFNKMQAIWHLLFEDQVLLRKDYPQYFTPDMIDAIVSMFNQDSLLKNAFNLEITNDYIYLMTGVTADSDYQPKAPKQAFEYMVRFHQENPTEPLSPENLKEYFDLQNAKANEIVTYAIEESFIDRKYEPTALLSRFKLLTDPNQPTH